MSSPCRLPRSLACLTVAAALAGAATLRAAAQTIPLRSKAAPRAAPNRVIGTPFTAGPRRAALATIAETEPNDSLATADPVSLGDTVAGAINPGSDVDYFVVAIPAGTRVDLDVDANEVGSPLDPVMALFDSTGAMLAYSDDADHLDPHIRYTAPRTARYYVGIRSYNGSGGSQYTYLLKLGTVLPGPGDPTTLFATNLGYPYGAAADASGNLFVVDLSRNVVERIDRAGAVSTWATFGVNGAPAAYAVDLVVDGFGDLLAAGADSAFQGGAIMKISASNGRVTRFAHLPSGQVTAVTVGPDGDVRAASAGWIRRFDPLGAPKDSVFVGYAVRDLAFSPSGRLHFTSGLNAVLAVTGTRVDTVIVANPYVETLAFDRDGYLYVANGYLGEIALYDPSYRRVGDAFARTNLGGPLSIVFGRAPDGAMTSRLFAVNAGYNLAPPYIGSIVEMNPAGMRAAGFRIGVDLLRLATTELRPGVIGEEYADTLVLAPPAGGQVSWSIARGALPAGLTLEAGTGRITGIPERSGRDTVTFRADAGARFGFGSYQIGVVAPVVSVEDAVSQLLGAGVLTVQRERYLDFMGNHNGRYDVGDLRAFLRASGQLQSAAGPAGRVAREDKP